MRGFGAHLRAGLRLHFRNRLALIYGYLFPLVFLGAFAVLYRHEPVPLLRHVGELLTVTLLGGACFGLPTTLVSERERGVWRRYRVTPVSVATLVASTVATRYLLLLSAGLVQLAAAGAIGLTWPACPAALFVAFSVAALALIGLGLLVAMLADTVPAVQALGQCLFLPMLIVGGVAVPLSVLPDWAQRVASFLPGRYAVEAIQACVTGSGLAGFGFHLGALLVIGGAAGFSAARLFRWEPGQRFAGRRDAAWILPAVAAWIAVGLAAEAGEVAPVSVQAPAEAAATAALTAAAVLPPEPSEPAPPPWASIGPADRAKLDFNLPPDRGVVTPYAGPGDQPDAFTLGEVASVRQRLGLWRPGFEGDEVQRIRHLLCVPAIADAAQHPTERYLPPMLLVHLEETYSRDTLLQVLTWIAMHPEDGSIVMSLADLGLDAQAPEAWMVRERSYYYALKYLVRLDPASAATAAPSR
jgi:hypothetical protein